MLGAPRVSTLFTFWLHQNKAAKRRWNQNKSNLQRQQNSKFSLTGIGFRLRPNLINDRFSGHLPAGFIVPISSLSRYHLLLWFSLSIFYLQERLHSLPVSINWIFFKSLQHEAGRKTHKVPDGPRLVRLCLCWNYFYFSLWKISAWNACLRSRSVYVREPLRQDYRVNFSFHSRLHIIQFVLIVKSVIVEPEWVKHKNMKEK